MTPEQEQFAQWFEKKAPYLLPMFNFKQREYLPEKVDSYLSVCSHGEAIMLRFFLSVWRNDNEFNFDLIDAAKNLSTDNLKIIEEWINNPLFP